MDPVETGRGSAVIFNVSQGIDNLAVAQHFEMQVGSGRPPCRSHQGDNLSFLDSVTDRNKVFTIVRIARYEAVSVVYLDQLAKAKALVGPGDNAGGHRYHLGTVTTSKINALVSRFATGKGIRAYAKK